MQLQALRSTQHGKFPHAPQEEVKSASSPNRVTAVRNLDSHSWETPDKASSCLDMCPLPRHCMDRRVWDKPVGGQGVGAHSSKGTSVSWSCLDSGCWGGSNDDLDVGGVGEQQLPPTTSGGGQSSGESPPGHGPKDGSGRGSPVWLQKESRPLVRVLLSGKGDR